MQPYKQLVTDIQSNLYAFIFSLLGDGEGASDVLQETNLVLWQKEEEYDASRKFGPWAFQIAYYQVLAYRKRKHRDRHVFDDELISLMAEEYSLDSTPAGQRLEALAGCMKRLDERQQVLLNQRYNDAVPLASIADKLGLKVGAIKASLFRIRRLLAQCIEHRLQREGVS